MPIYDQGYRRHDARGPLRSLRFWPITREELRLVLAKRAFLGLLGLGWLPFIGFVIFFYAVTRFPEASRVVPVDGSLFARFFVFQFPLALLLTTFGGAGLVANDLRTGAILVYLSRPLTRRDYVIGKLSALMALNLSITLAPGLSLYAVGVALAPDHLLKWELAGLAPAIALYAVAVAAVLSLLALAISALSRSARVAGLSFIAILAGLEIVRGILWSFLRSEYLTLLSIEANLRSLGNALLGAAEAGSGVHWTWAALVLAGVGLACLAVLRARVRAVEIVT